MRPLLVYDGDCSFCRAWIARWRSVTDDQVDYAPFQSVARHFPDMSEAQWKTSVQLIEVSGQVYQGAEAVFRTLSYAPRRGWMLWIYRYLPGMSLVSELCYRLVARHRGMASTWTRYLPGPWRH